MVTYFRASGEIFSPSIGFITTGSENTDSITTGSENTDGKNNFCSSASYE